MSADSEKPNIIGRNIALWQNLWVGVGRFDRRSSSARASLALCGRFNQFRSSYSWITMRRALRKRRVFDFVPSYLNSATKMKENATRKMAPVSGPTGTEKIFRACISPSQAPAKHTIHQALLRKRKFLLHLTAIFCTKIETCMPNSTRRGGFGWVDKAQCFWSARRFGAVGSSPDFSRVFHDIWLLGI